MALKEDIASEVGSILSQPWDIRDGKVVPTSKDVALAGGGVKLSVAVLYSDLANSTHLAMNFDRRVAAKVAKCFMAICSRMVRHHGGEIRSFDGDRVMGVFLGGTKNTDAVKAGLQINWCFQNVLKPKCEGAYPDLKSKFTLSFCTGIDTSEVLVVRGGIRNNNDLVWVGRAPNVAAKLSNIRDGDYRTWITAAVYDVMMDDAKKSSDGRAMWEKRSWTKGPVTDVYRSNWSWVP